MVLSYIFQILIVLHVHKEFDYVICMCFMGFSANYMCVNIQGVSGGM
jgi:hypothetical protein